MTTNYEVVSFSFWVAVTISIDVSLYSLAKATVEKLNFSNWTLPVACAHLILMGVISISFFVLENTFIWIQFPLSLVGAGFISLYIYEIVREWSDQIPKISITTFIASHFSSNLLLAKFTPAVLAVSWDCLPVAAGITIETELWTSVQLLLALATIGLTVALSTQTSIYLALWFKRVGYKSSLKTRVIIGLLCKWIILTMLSTFFLLTIRNGLSPWFEFSGQLALYKVVSFSLIMVTTLFWIKFPFFLSKQLKESSSIN